MRHVIEAEGTIPAGCPDPQAIVTADFRAVSSRAAELMRTDRRWKFLVSPRVDYMPDGRTYRVHCLLDTETGTMPNPGST